MTKYIYPALLLLCGAVSFAQTATQNYVTETVYKNGRNPSGIYLAGPDNFVTTTYYDGSGRPIQQVQQNASPLNDKNIVTHIEYEKNKGQLRSYLPFTTEGKVTTTTGGSFPVTMTTYNSNYTANAQQATLTYYNVPKYENTPNPYSETRKEASPTERVTEAGAPGINWSIGVYEGYGVSEDDRYTVRYKYAYNTANEVKRFTAASVWNTQREVFTSTLSENGYYPASTLKKTITRNENWKPDNGKNNTTEEFKGSDGKVVLKRTYNNGEAHDTYYVHDFYGNLSYVIPPLANGSVAGDNLDKLCYQYLYDEKNRLVEKKLPQKGWEYIVYDKADRIVFAGPVTNPFNTTARGWILTKYDNQNRIIYTGFYNGHTVTAENRKVMKTTIYAQVDNNESKATADVTIDGIAVRYTNNRFPTSFNLLTVNYYDDYAFPGAPGSFPAVEGVTPIQGAKGLPTGSWVRVITTASERKADVSYTLYNAKYQAIRSYTATYLGGYQQTDNQLTFRGLSLKTVTTHKKDASATLLTVTNNYTYDNRERLKTQTQQINGGTAKTIAEHVYDELGVLETKKVGGSSSNPLQKVDYKYNIRGWLTDINNAEYNHIDTENDLFQYKVNYNTNSNGSMAQYNGNINSIYSRTKTDNVFRGYEYHYDDLNRLTLAKNLYYQNSGWMMGVQSNDAYNESISYDKNGNITTLKRTGEIISGQKTDIDDLTYAYSANQLLSVTDAVNNAGGFNDGNKVGNDYTYDEFGNLKTDKNKGITSITYNHLNLPVELVFPAGKITYTYNAAGAKLKKVVQPATGTVQTTDYLYGFEYLNGSLQFFPHAEGYVKPNGTNAYLYVYQYKDHLGNVRLSYADCDGNGSITASTEILEENNYYPFGLKHLGYNQIASSCRNEAAEQYKYNGKEYEDSFGLNMYEYGARNYDPAVGRFFNIDRLSEKYETLSPYNYTANNPIVFIDVDGEWIGIEDGDNKYRYMMGGNVQRYDSQKKKWEEVEDMKSLSFYVQQVIANLYELEVSGTTGNAVIGYFNNDNRQANFKGYRGETAANTLTGNIVIQTGFVLPEVLTVNGWSGIDGNIKGKLATTMFVVFGHELAHIIDKYENPGNYQDIWVEKGLDIEKTARRTEIFASHIENQIRAQSGLPLRQYYGRTTNDDGRKSGTRGTLLLDTSNNALYFKQTQPGIFDIKNRGEIINKRIEKIEFDAGRYNYGN